jgi:hypothetical protein
MRGGGCKKADFSIGKMGQLCIYEACSMDDVAIVIL